MHKSSFWDYDMARRSRSRLAFFLLLIIPLFYSCRKDPHPADLTAKIDHFRAFYHWKTVCSLSTEERKWLDSLQIDRLYIKFFDLDWDPESASVIPLASVQLDTHGLGKRRIIPAIFITNRSMMQVATEDIPELAQRMVSKIDGQFARINQSLTEIQLDCDWTMGSRANYFRLLETLQSTYESRGVVLSVTIRLHQLRYPDQTGVPPVKKGVLMFYNMGDLQDWQETNSILNLKKAEAYLPDGLSYPLHLDLALPLFRWAILFRDGQMIKLINEPDTALLNRADYYHILGPNRYEVIQNTYLDGYYLYRGDQLRLESVSLEQLRAALVMVRSQYPPASGNLILYHLDTAVVKRYNLGKLIDLMKD